MAPSKTALAAAPKKISKVQMVKEAVQALGESALPTPIRDHIKKTFGVDISTNHVSNIRSHLRKGGKSKNRGRKPGKRYNSVPEMVRDLSNDKKFGESLARKLESNGRANGSSLNGHGIALDDLTAVKALAQRVGKGELHRLVDLVG